MDVDGLVGPAVGHPPDVGEQVPARTSTPPGTIVVKLRPLAARRTSAFRGAGAPRDVPSGRNTVTGVVLFSAFTWATVARRRLVPSVGTNGAIHWALTVAELTARSAASVRSTRASGIKKETSTRELAATTSRMMRSLIGGR